MVVTYPLITLSTRAQVDIKKVHANQLEAVKRILEREGIAGLYAGLQSALFGIGVTNGIYYFFYEWSKELLGKARSRKAGPLTTAESMLAGLLAGSATVFATNPIWVINTRVTARKEAVDQTPDEVTKAIIVKKSPPGALSVLAATIKEEGIPALWSGVAPALVLVVNPIIQYTIFEQMKNLIQKTRKLTPWDAFLLGAFGKLIATGSTYPYITLKARMQLRQSQNKDEQYNSLWTGLQKIVKGEGVQGLYKGVGPKLIQSVLTAAFLFMFKERLFAESQKVIARIPGNRAALTSGITATARA